MGRMGFSLTPDYPPCSSFKQRRHSPPNYDRENTVLSNNAVPVHGCVLTRKKRQRRKKETNASNLPYGLPPTREQVAVWKSLDIYELL